MKKTAAVLIAAGAFAGIANADVIVYEMTGTIGLLGGADAGQLDGASFTFTAYYDDSGVYIDRFGLPSVDGGLAEYTIAGSGNGANNTTTNSNENSGFYPTFAGNFSSPDGLQLTFNTGDGNFFTYTGNTGATPGSVDAFIGGPIELDDFAPGATYGAADGGVAFTGAGGDYTLFNVEITAEYIPAPGALALLGLGGLAASRRRR